MTIAWVDPSGGVAGDMLLAACLDAGARLEVVQSAIDALSLPEPVRVETQIVRRGVFRARRAVVTAGRATGERHLSEILALIEAAELAAPVADAAARVFTELARAEARAHGIDVPDVHFHEVGALDSIADVVGVTAALHDLGIERLASGPISLGGGRIRVAHGEVSVPGPAVIELLRGTPALAAGGPIPLELATPTGVALLVTLADAWGPMPMMQVEAVGVGAGTADPAGHVNVTRLLVGSNSTSGAASHDGGAVVVEANVDDLDPRLWPGIVSDLLRVGAADAWLTPILMKKGRPAHTLHVLVSPDRLPEVLDATFERSSTIGIRHHDVTKVALDREMGSVEVFGETVRVKIARHRGRVVNVSPEYEDVAEAARRSGRTEKAVLDAARAVAAQFALGP